MSVVLTLYADSQDKTLDPASSLDDSLQVSLGNTNLRQLVVWRVDEPDILSTVLSD